MKSVVKNKWYIAGLHFECRQCGKCCSGLQEGVIWISRHEINMLADRLGITASELRKKHLKRIGFRSSIKENPCSKDCIFLAELNGSKGCTIYDVRPMQCRSWPFWPGNLQSPDDWNTAATKCPGVNKGRLYTFDEIQKIKNQKQWWNSGNNLAAAVHGGLYPPPLVAGDKSLALICDQVAKIYDWLDSNLKPSTNRCSACGKCCNFESFGHKLFVTTPELLYFSKNVKNLRSTSTQTPLEARCQRRLTATKGGPPLTGQTCPYLENDKCGARNYRFAGCRIFFCKTDTELQTKLSEETVKKFRLLCDKFNFPYRYIDLMTALNSERNQ